MEDNVLLKEVKARRFKFWVALFLIVASVGGGYKLFNYLKYRSQYQALQNYNALVEKMKNDTYGGATPEETLDLFVAALREGDVEKASLYFALDENGSREKWLKLLNDNKNNFANLAEIFEAAYKDNSSYAGQIWFKTFDKDGSPKLIDLIYNGKVWKIESL